MAIVSDERFSKIQPSSRQQDHLLSESNPDSMSAHAMCAGPVTFGAYNKALDAIRQLIFIRHADQVMCTSNAGDACKCQVYAWLLLICMPG